MCIRDSCATAYPVATLAPHSVAALANAQTSKVSSLTCLTSLTSLTSILSVNPAPGLLALAVLTFRVQALLARRATGAGGHAVTGTMEGAAQDNLKAGHGVGPVVELATGERGDDVQHAFAVERTTQAREQPLALLVIQAGRLAHIEQQLHAGFRAVDVLTARAAAAALGRHSSAARCVARAPRALALHATAAPHALVPAVGQCTGRHQLMSRQLTYLVRR